MSGGIVFHEIKPDELEIVALVNVADGRNVLVLGIGRQSLATVRKTTERLVELFAEADALMDEADLLVVDIATASIRPALWRDLRD